MKTLDENRWLLIRGLFRSRDRFLQLFRGYERRVLRHSRELDVDRSALHLPWEEVRTLLDFSSLEQLRDHVLLPLKEVAHDLFRSSDSTDQLDILVAQVYHEISMLKEEQYTLKEDYLAKDARAYDRLYREIREYYPSRLRHIRGLFDRARRRLERILPTMMEGSIVVRSIYLFGEEILGSAFRDGLAGFYRRAYPREGETRGYLDAGASFRRGGFHALASDALDRARQSRSRARKRRPIDDEIERETAALADAVRALEGGIPDGSAGSARPGTPAAGQAASSSGRPESPSR